MAAITRRQSDSEGKVLETETAQVRATITYLGAGTYRPTVITEAHNRMHAVALDPRDVPICNFRDAQNRAKLSTTGFELVAHQSRVTDFASGEQLRKIYDPEIRELLRAMTGASKIHLTTPILRWSERERHPERVNSRPARVVHVDYTRDSFHEFAKEHVREDLNKERLLAGRYAVFNIWRAVSPPPQDCLLACIDRRTTTIDDVVEGEIVTTLQDLREERIGTSFYTWNPRHKWGYFGSMTRDEVLVFLAYDSADDALPGSPHSAFDDPTCPPDTVPRASCELRAYVYWG